MKKLVLGCVMFLGACEAGGTMGGSPGMQERLVIGNRMTFEECRARGGLIIRDQGSPMIACDPSVRGEPVPADDLTHPDA